ncbi:MAG: chemotaxis protein CheB [Synechococcaceae cyanobacterium]
MTSAAELDHVVAIGASAGGLEAIEDLLAQLPLGSKCVYVVAQHLSPHHPSQLVELLKSCTRLVVVGGSDQMPLQPDQVIVVPPGCDATFAAGGLRLVEPEPRFGPSPSIDRLFVSLASEWGNRSIGVVLSGTGSDGAYGLRVVGAAGGATLVQSPKSARFNGMPQAAIALARVDLVADPTTLGTQLNSWLSSNQAWLNPNDEEALPIATIGIAAQLKQLTGVDFTQYKESTLQRQIQRRMAIRGSKDIDTYLALLTSETEEAKALLHSILVKVTSFFRDPESFEALRRQLETLLASHASGERLRVWVPACATGEEAYSIGMTISAVLKHPQNLSQYLKIFATDLDEQSLAIGRRGIYSMASTKMIPSEYLDRFTLAHVDGIEICKELRSCLVFARHNVTEDPPFPNIDLISCRNAFIYFTAPLQERVIDFFAFSLNEGGLLFLGSSESLGRISGFAVVNPVHRIYERNRQNRGRIRMGMTKPVQVVPLQQRSPHAQASVRDMVPEQHVRLLEELVRTLAHPCLVVDDNHDLVEVVGDVSPYCKLPAGRLPAAVGAYLKEDLQSEARTLLLLVRADRTAASSGSLQVAGLEHAVRLEAAPLQVSDQPLTVLAFVQEGQASALQSTHPGGSDRDAAFACEIERLERELLASQDSLRRSIADLEQVNEELEASSEELQASSEELQSSNEELEASNEELQATNEELADLNQQLRQRSDQLEKLNNELENIQGSLSQGMVIVDQKLCITRFSPLAVRVFGLVDSDIGQPLIGVPTTVPLAGLREALQAVVNGEVRRTLEASNEEVSYFAQIMPYLDQYGSKLGAIITLTDVSELVSLRRAAEASLSEFERLADALEQVVWKRDHTMSRMLYVSRRIEMLGGWTTDEILREPELLDEAIHRDDRPAVAQARQRGSSGWSVSYRLATRSRGERRVQEVATPLEDGHDFGFVGTLADITAQAIVDRATHLLALGVQALMAADDAAVVVVDQGLRLLFVSPDFGVRLGLPSQPLPDTLLPDLALHAEPPDPSLPAPPSGSLRDQALHVLQEGQPLQLPSARLLVNGQERGPFQLAILPIVEAADRVALLIRLR